jgi:uncharacterized protein (UPF0303 family)
MTASPAPIYSMAQLAEEERDLQLPELGHEGAFKLGLILADLARTRDLTVATGVDLGEQRVFRAAMPGTSADHDDWLERKFATVRHFDRCSLELELRLGLEAAYATERGLDTRRFALTGGAFPLRVGDSLAGIVGVAGLRSVEDHALAVEAVREFLR